MAAAKGAGLILLHAWWGLNADVLARAKRLRAEGYEVVTPDLFGGHVAYTIDEAKALTKGEQENEGALTELVDGAVRDLARKVDRIGIVGWSFGVWYAWKMGIAHPDTVRGLALFYGIGPNEPDAPTTPVLAHYAEHDEFEDIGFARKVEQEMTAAGNDVRVELYPGTKHWFDEPSRPEYDKAASELAWDRTHAFFRQHLGSAKR
ncbi:MAG: dienelactone hydrolase family protein [Chloroflexota bacterium]|nr:dienelactone hydrolase family protein [Chloroflexota bacterium]